MLLNKLSQPLLSINNADSKDCLNVFTLKDYC